MSHEVIIRTIENGLIGLLLVGQLWITVLVIF